MSLQLTDYFNHIFADLLSAFRKGYSCQSTLLNMIEHFRCALARGVYIACISMDISKAFGCLPDCLSICKLHAYGLSRDACTLIASYLYQRKHAAGENSKYQKWMERNEQRCASRFNIRALDFNIFMNDLSYFVKSGNLFNYADDNSVSVSNKELDIVRRL